MIILCESCNRKFVVKDSDIPKKGRMVQCGYCSQKWFQAPIKIQSSIESDVGEDIPKMEFEASDGRTYRFLGNQWAELLHSGKTGILAKKKISTELNKLAGIVKPKRSKKKMEEIGEVEITNISKTIDPSSEQIDSEAKQKKGLGFFGYIFLLIVITLSIVGVLKVFQNELLMYFPQAQYIYDKAEYIFETFDNIIVIIQDLINTY